MTKIQYSIILEADDKTKIAKAAAVDKRSIRSVIARGAVNYADEILRRYGEDERNY